MSKFSRFVPLQEEDAIARQRRENAEALADADELGGPDKVRGPDGVRYLARDALGMAAVFGWFLCLAAESLSKSSLHL
jgi:hypothetical protein